MLDANIELRIKFRNGEQKKFLEKALSDIKLSELAKIAGVCDRTLRDWRREKYNISFSSLERICGKLKIDLPCDVKILPAYWSVEF